MNSFRETAINLWIFIDETPAAVFPAVHVLRSTKQKHLPMKVQSFLGSVGEYLTSPTFLAMQVELFGNHLQPDANRVRIMQPLLRLEPSPMVQSNPADDRT